MRAALLAVALLAGCAQAPYDPQRAAQRQECLDRVAAQQRPQQVVRGRETIVCQRINTRGDVECRDTTSHVVVPNFAPLIASLGC